jgi:hypothetical protein
LIKPTLAVAQIYEHSDSVREVDVRLGAIAPTSAQRAAIDNSRVSRSDD